MQRITSAPVFAIGDDRLDRLDCLEVLGFGSGTLFHVHCDDTDGPSLDMTRLSAVCERTVTGPPHVHDNALGSRGGGGEQPFVFSAQFGARQFEFPLEAGNTMQRHQMPHADALLRRELVARVAPRCRHPTNGRGSIGEVRHAGRLVHQNRVGRQG